MLDMPKLVVCGHCKQQKRFTEMGRQASGKNGLHSWCKECINRWNRENRKRRCTKEQKADWSLRTRYGITAKQRDEMFQGQGGVCAICNEVPARAVVDHNHSTGEVRGILCHSCNVKLHAVDKWEHLGAAMAYLGKK